MFGICNISIIPCRAEPSNKSEMISQLLFGEHFIILEEKDDWVKIKNASDKYESWINQKQFISIKESTFNSIDCSPKTIVSELFALINNKKTNHNFPVPMGSYLPIFNNGNFIIEENSEYSIDISSTKSNFTLDINKLIQTAFVFLNTPYLWGGKSCFGIDCSGFAQICFATQGIFLPRDAYQQAEIGYPLSFVEEAQAGDLAFFDNEDGKIIHVGIVLNDSHIIHASGKVRVDPFDHYGIFHSERKKYSHQLRVIKRFFY
jgi:cell wall-associated NlpC family hydrolase